MLSFTCKGCIPETVMDVLRILLTVTSSTKGGPFPKRGTAILQLMILRLRERAVGQLEAAKDDLVQRGFWIEEEYPQMWEWAREDILAFRVSKPKDPENDGTPQSQGRVKMRGHLIHGKHQ